MKAEIKYIALLFLANILSMSFLPMLFSWDFRPGIIPAMVILGVCSSIICLWVGMLWMKAENIIFLTKDTVIDGVKMGDKKANT